MYLHGGGGIVRDVRVFTRAAGDELAPGVKQISSCIYCTKRKINEGDKMAGRHGNKGLFPVLCRKKICHSYQMEHQLTSC